MLINVKIPIIVGILTFMSRKKNVFSLVEPEKSFITNYQMVYLSKLGLNPSIPNFLDKIKYFEAG